MSRTRAVETGRPFASLRVDDPCTTPLRHVDNPPSDVDDQAPGVDEHRSSAKPSNHHI